MMKNRSADELRDKFYAGKWRCHRELRLAQEQLGDEVIFDTLFGVFLDENISDNRFDIQQDAGYCLLGLLPNHHHDLEASIFKSLKMWNRSVEELPWYFFKKYGKSAVLKVLNEIETNYLLSDNEKEKVGTYRYWLRPNEDQLNQWIDKYRYE